MKFQKVDPGFKTKRYRRYRPYTQNDFRRICAYCFCHEYDLGGEDHFDQDHFEPQHRANVDPGDYFNIFWSCKACNGRRNKSTTWPTQDQIDAGEGFCNPCAHDPLGQDYKQLDDGSLEALSAAGCYTIRHIRLNDRIELVAHRKSREDLRKGYEAEAQRLLQALAILKQRQASKTTVVPASVLDEIQRLAEMLESLAKTEPFILRDRAVLPKIPDEIQKIAWALI